MGIKLQIAKQQRKKRKAHFKTVCFHCFKALKGFACTDSNHLAVRVSYKARTPKKEASKKKWQDFADLFVRYNPEAYKHATKLIKEKR